MSQLKKDIKKAKLKLQLDEAALEKNYLALRSRIRSPRYIGAGMLIGFSAGYILARRKSVWQLLKLTSKTSLKAFKAYSNAKLFINL